MHRQRTRAPLKLRYNQIKLPECINIDINHIPRIEKPENRNITLEIKITKLQKLQWAHETDLKFTHTDLEYFTLK